MAFCSNTYKQDIPGCIPTIEFDLDLLPNTDYLVKITLPSGKGLWITITTDYGGYFTFTKDSDLEGFWNMGTGEVVITVETNGDCVPQSFDHCNAVYGIIVLNFININTDELVIDVPCTCPE